MQSESARSRAALAAMLSRIREPLGGSDLWTVTHSAAALCSDAFEKVYLAKLAGRMSGASEEASELAGLAAELFMFAALTVDDWADESGFRAGKSAIHSVHGPGNAVLAANCLSEAAHLALDEATSAISVPMRAALRQSFRAAVLSIQAGQASVAELAGTAVKSPAVLERLARQRCGYMISAAMRAGAVLGNCDRPDAMAECGLWLGTALQHRNDIQDFTVAFDQTIKPPLADLLNGQPNLVVCFILQALPRMNVEERELVQLLHARNRLQPGMALSATEFTAMIELCVRHEALHRATRRLATCIERSLAALAGCQPTPALGEFRDYLQLVLQP